MPAVDPGFGEGSPPRDLGGTRPGRGRFAPSPTGLLHLGNARTALLAWLWARSEGGGFTLRIEDLDRQRSRDDLAAAQLTELEWLGLGWDEGPDPRPPHAERGSRGPYRQSQRSPLYDQAIDELRRCGLIYGCFCSRAEVRALAEANAPHGPGDDGPRYPGTCRDLGRDQASERRRTRTPSLRLRVAPGEVSFTDALAGPQRFDPQAEVGDFVVRRADGVHAYQLAVVVDDAAMGVTQVLRGADLLPSTARQILLCRALALPEPRWAHAPLLQVAGADGEVRRLSKRDGADTLTGLRDRGVDPHAVVAFLARSAGLAALGPCAPEELLATFSLAAVGGAQPLPDQALHALVPG